MARWVMSADAADRRHHGHQRRGVHASTTSGNFLYSVFSAREFLLAFLGPGIYLLCRCGLPLAHLALPVAGAVCADAQLPVLLLHHGSARRVLFLSDHTVSNLVTYDAWRGFRLKPPLFAIMVALLAPWHCCAYRRAAPRSQLAPTAIGLAAYIWSIVLFRSTLATMLLSVLLYPLLLSQRNRLKLVAVSAPLALIAAPIAASFAVENFLEADGGSIRAKAFAQAVEHIRSTRSSAPAKTAPTATPTRTSWHPTSSPRISGWSA
jgi:hypothetical protein